MDGRRRPPAPADDLGAAAVLASAVLNAGVYGGPLARGTMAELAGEYALRSRVLAAVVVMLGFELAQTHPVGTLARFDQAAALLAPGIN